MFTFRNNHRFNGRSRRVLAALACGLLLCSPAGTVAGQDCAIIVGGDLIIPDGCTYTINGTESYEDVYVLSGGILNLGSGAVLVVDETLYVHADGAFRFNASCGAVPKVRANGYYYPVSLEGAFTVTGPAGKRRAVVYKQNDMFLDQMKHVVRHFAAGKQPLATGPEALASLAIADAVPKSGARRRAVTL